MIGKDFFLKKYYDLQEDHYDLCKIDELNVHHISDVDQDQQAIAKEFANEGYVLIDFLASISLPEIRRWQDKLFGDPVPDSGAQKTIYTEIKAEENGVYFANSTYTQPLHMDDAHTESPPRIITLYCVKQSSQGGTTTILPVNKLLGNIIHECDPVYLELFKHDAMIIKGMKGKIVRSFLSELEQGRVGLCFPAILDALESSNEIEQLYRRIMDFIHLKENQIRFRLKPHQLLVLDNFRTFHGRTKFALNDPRRLFRTCYTDQFFRHPL